MNRKQWKKLSAVLLSLLLLCVLTAVPSFAATSADYAIDTEYYENNPYRGTVLNVYNWGEYISDGSEDSLNVNAYFEELTGITVNYTNFASNEDMYAKIKGGGANYDVIIPSDYMIERMIEEGMLEKLDFNNIPTYEYIDDQYKDLYFDPNNEYSVPYTVSYVAMVYNTTLMDEAPDSWEILWDEEYAGQILMFNNPRDAFAIAQSLLGLDYNSSDPSDWQQAYNKLLEQKPVVRSYVMDEVYNIMESGSAAIAPYYVGDALTMMDTNPDLAIAYPKEGANIFVDSMCIPTCTQNKGAAELYINFMNEIEVALANAEYVMYGTPNTVVRELDDYSLRDSEVLYPEESTFENYQYFHNLDSEVQTLMTNLWSDLKVDGNSDYSSYIGLGCFAALALGYLIFHEVRKRKRAKYYD